MKEGMVLEINKDYVTVLTKGGEYLKLRKKGEVNIGDLYKGRPYFKLPNYYVAAAVMLIVISSYTGITAYANQIVGYVDISGDKNVRLYVNRKGTVQKAEGVTNSASLKNLTVENAAKEISKLSEKEGLYEDSSKVKVSTKEIKSSGVNLNKEKEKLEKALQDKEDKTNNKNQEPQNQKDKKIKNPKDTVKSNGSSINRSNEEQQYINKSDSKSNQNNSSKNGSNGNTKK